jgi:hypothetical protein
MQKYQTILYSKQNILVKENVNTGKHSIHIMLGIFHVPIKHSNE